MPRETPSSDRFATAPRQANAFGNGFASRSSVRIIGTPVGGVSHLKKTLRLVLKVF